LTSTLEEVFNTLARVVERHAPRLVMREEGRISYMGSGVARIHGLPNAQSEELLSFPDQRLGMAFNLDANEVGTIMLDHGEGIKAGDPVHRTGRVIDVPVGEGLIGRVVDPAGRPLDGGAAPRCQKRLPVERPAPAIMDRTAVHQPLQTGLKVVDALIPIGRGQRELILGDRQTGKTAIALDAIVNQAGGNIVCIYCAIGQQSSAVAKVIADLRKLGAMEYSIVMVTTGEDPPGVQFIAPYAATSVGEHFMAQGRDVLVVYDDLTRHARAYREVSLLLRRPPGREAFPGDIFYIHSRLLERATHLREDLGGGSLTALPIAETEAQNVSAYIPTNLISITDGQLYVNPDLFQQGVLPAVDIGKSVSRVGGKAQLPAYRSVAGALKLSYSQFEELERFSRYGARLEPEKRRTLERGRRVREVFKQSPYSPLSPAEQVLVLFTVTEGLLDALPLDDVPQAEQALREGLAKRGRALAARIEEGEKLTDNDREALRDVAVEALAPLQGDAGRGDN